MTGSPLGGSMSSPLHIATMARTGAPGTDAHEASSHALFRQPQKQSSPSVHAWSGEPHNDAAASAQASAHAWRGDSGTASSAGGESAGGGVTGSGAFVGCVRHFFLPSSTGLRERLRSRFRRCVGSTGVGWLIPTVHRTSPRNVPRPLMRGTMTNRRPDAISFGEALSLLSFHLLSRERALLNQTCTWCGASPVSAAREAAKPGERYGVRLSLSNTRRRYAVTRGDRRERGEVEPDIAGGRCVSVWWGVRAMIALSFTDRSQAAQLVHAEQVAPGREHSQPGM